MFETTFVAIPPVVAFIAVGYVQRATVRRRAESIDADVTDALSDLGPKDIERVRDLPSLRANVLEQSLTRDSDQIQLVAAILSVLPGLASLDSLPPVVWLLFLCFYTLLLVYVLVGRSRNGRRVTAARKALNVSPFGRLITWLPISTDSGALGFLSLLMVLYTSFDYDVLKSAIDVVGQLG